MISLIKMIADNFVRDKVQPNAGSILYVEMFEGIAEHSGIYVGNDIVVHLVGNGSIQRAHITEFMSGWKVTPTGIYISSRNGRAIGLESITKRALNMVGRKRSYNFLIDNCHQFCSGCITGNFENSDNFLWMLKDTAQKHMGADEWRIWDKYDIKKCISTRYSMINQ